MIFFLDFQYGNHVLVAPDLHQWGFILLCPVQFYYEFVASFLSCLFLGSFGAMFQYGIHVLVAPDVRRWGSVAAPADFLDNPIAPRKALAAPTMKLFHRAPFWSNTIPYPSSRSGDIWNGWNSFLFRRNLFTMIDDNFGIYCSKIPKNG